MTKKDRHVVNSLGKKEIDNDSLDILHRIIAWVKSFMIVVAALKIIGNVLKWVYKYIWPIGFIAAGFYAANLGKDFDISVFFK